MDYRVFSVHHFIDIYAKKLGLRTEVLGKTLGRLLPQRQSKEDLQGSTGSKEEASLCAVCAGEYLGRV